MTLKWAVTAVVLTACLGIIAANPALARVKHHKTSRHCVDRTSTGPTLYGFIFNPPPRWNGCAPPVYEYGSFIGQDPDPNVRYQLRRDPAEGDLNFKR
jgi:hypothetical protein